MIGDGLIVQCARDQLQVRLAVTVLAPGSLPHSIYKNSSVAVRGAA